VTNFRFLALDNLALFGICHDATQAFSID
jgi:hypothetical protein